ncbi:hypothetical protein [Saccharopolyspora taberi]|uniref:Uncharacterized protein n=1 Tax=Saccharopolyspora taberi TaxID=60895 RepID=A0ABN3V3L2_9PSEU
MSTSPTRSTGRPWLKWGVPLAAVVVALAALGGLVARTPAGRPTPDATSELAPQSLRADEGGGQVLVDLSPDATAHPDQSTVRYLLERHFNAINFKQYDVWKETVVPARQQEKPKKLWEREYQSTDDRDIRVHRIEPGPDSSLRVMLTFTSTQDPASSPDSRSRCLKWNVVYPLVPDSGGLRLDTARLPGSAQYAPC